MKATMDEYDTGWALRFEAETVADAATLVRLGVDCTKEICCLPRADVSRCQNGKGGLVTCAVYLGKRKDFSSMMPRRGER